MQVYTNENIQSRLNSIRDAFDDSYCEWDDLMNELFSGADIGQSIVDQRLGRIDKIYHKFMSVSLSIIQWFANPSNYSNEMAELRNSFTTFYNRSKTIHESMYHTNYATDFINHELHTVNTMFVECGDKMDDMINIIVSLIPDNNTASNTEMAIEDIDMDFSDFASVFSDGYNSDASTIPIEEIDEDTSSIAETIAYNSIGECSICLNSITRFGTTVVCGHAFHIECIASWCRIGNHGTCPICRGAL